jgi:SAM-dependent methyltransferase
MVEKMFEELERIHEPPEPFQYYTAEDLWTDEHTSAQMLSYHLNEEIDVASRSADFIERSVAWMVSRFGIGEGTAIADFGCGPGLYAGRLAQNKAQVTGIDFSRRSIEFARQAAASDGLSIRYVNDDYLRWETEARFDLIIMILCDFCALSPVQRKHMLMKFRSLLRENGSVLLDVYSFAYFQEREETVQFGLNLLDGFWAPGKYYGFLNTFKYETRQIVLDKYTIIQPDQIRTVYNWLQCFSPESLSEEFRECGLSIQEVYADITGAPYDPNSIEFAVGATGV